MTTNIIQNRYDFVYLFDVTDGNPNGDPDAGNQPRIDPETGEGLITDVCIKRKIRNVVPLLCNNANTHDIYFQTQDAPNERRILNLLHQQAQEAVAALVPPEPEKPKEEPAPATTKKTKGQGKADAPAKSADTARLAREWMCKKYWDVRTFGAVMTTGVNCGQVRGPLQLTFSRSIGRILSLEHAITRKSVTTIEDAQKQIGKDGTITGTLGRKMTVPYGLYRCHGYISPYLAAQTGFSEDDLALLWRALVQMFEHDRSATRGQMSARGLYVFKHESALGNAPSHVVQGLVDVKATSDVPRKFSDFAVTVAGDKLPPGVALMQFSCDSFADTPIIVNAAKE
jgi:CRISPR-associated protein Csd2